MTLALILYIIGLAHSIADDFSDMAIEDIGLGFMGWAYIFLTGLSWPVWRLVYAVNILKHFKAK